VLRFTEKETQRYLQMLSQPLVECFVSIAMDSPDTDRLASLENMVGTVEQLTSGTDMQLSSHGMYTSPVIPIEDELDYFSKSPIQYLLDLMPDKPGDLDGTLPYSLHLTIDELAALWHLPSTLFEGSGIPILRPSVLPEPLLDPNPKTAVILGTTGGRQVGIHKQDLNMHLFISGMQGQGKSTVLANLAQQLIRDGEGVAIIDPHQKLINSVIAGAIDKQAAKRTILLEASDREYPIPLNPMRATPGMTKEALLSSLMWMIKALYASNWSEGQMERMFRNILQVVITDPEATPLDIQKLVDDPNYRRRALAANKKSMGRLPRSLIDFWDNFEGQSDSVQRERTNPVLNRLGVFLDGQAELMMSHPFGLDFRTLINDKKVVLLDLGGESLLSDANEIGSIFFAMLFFHAYALGQLEDGAPPRYYVILDETHRFLRAPIQQMFSEARKYGLAIIMVDQWLGQLDEHAREGIINNRVNTLSFKLAPAEARASTKLYEPYVTTDDIIKQGKGEAAAAMVYHGQTMPAFQLKTLPPLKGRFNVQQRRAAAKLAIPSILFSPDPTLKPKVMTVAEIDGWLEQRYTSGVFARDLNADAVYQDTEPVVEDTPLTTVPSADDEYTDTEEVE
jgi:hypothetical protein